MDEETEELIIQIITLPLRALVWVGEHIGLIILTILLAYVWFYLPQQPPEAIDPPHWADPWW